jgi:PST family polysaccharide transporter
MAESSAPGQEDDTTSRESRGRATFTGQAAHGIGWTGLSVITIALLQLLYTAFTSRQLSLREFGFYASAQAFATLIGYASMTSLGLAVMRVPDDEARGLGLRAGTLAAVAGGLCGLVTFLGSDLWARAWHVNGAQEVIRVIAVSVTLAPVAAVVVALVRRQLRYKRAALIEFLAALVGFAAGAIMVVQTDSAVGLAAGQVAVSVTTILLGLVVMRAPHAYATTTSTRQLLRFGYQVSGQNLAFYLIYSLPPYGIAAALGPTGLGLFSRANLLVMLPVSQAGSTISRVLYPLWSRVTDASRRSAITDLLVVSSLLSFLMFGVLAGSADLVVDLLLGPQFQAASSLTALMSVYGAIYLVASLAGPIQESAGWFPDVWKMQVTLLLVIAPATALLWLTGDIWVSVVGLGLGQVCAHFQQVRFLARRSAVDQRTVLRAYAAHAAVGISAAMVVYGADQLAHGWFFRILLTSSAGFVVLTALVVCGDKLPGVSVLVRRELIPRRFRIAGLRSTT